jgi:hypothetical protein
MVKVLEVEGPEGASADQVKQFAAENYYADPANAPKDYSLGEIVSKGFGRGAKRIGSTIGDVLPAMGASALGFDEYAKKQMQEAQASEENISRTMAPQYPSYKDVKGVGDAGKFVLETAFEQIPNLFGIIGTGGVGGVAGGIAAKTAAKKATEALTKKELKKQLSEQASARAAKKILSDINKSKATGQAAGVFLGSYALNAPEVFQNIYEQTGDFEPLAASLAGIVNASLDSILPTSIMKSFSKPGRASVVTEILQKSGMQPGLARRATSNILGGLGTEGLTEATQEAVSIAAEKFVQGHSAIFDSDDFDRMLEAGIKGAVAGGAFKGVASVPEHLREKALTKKASPEKQEEIIEETKLVDTTVTTPVATTQAATTTTEEVVEPQPSTEARDQEAANVLAQQAKVEQLQKDLDTQLLDEKSITQVMEKDLNTYFGGYTETERKQIRNDLKKLRSEVIKAKTLGRTAETDAANRKQTVINKVNPDQIGITPAMLESVGITADTVGQDMINYFTERPFSSKEVADFGKQAQAMLTKAKTGNNVEVITKFGNLKKALPKLRKEIENVRNRTAEYTAGTAGVSDGSVGVSDSITTESTVGPVGAPVVVDPNVAGTVESGTSGEPRSLTQRINALKARIKIDDPQSDIITELDNIVDEDPAGALNFVEQLESEFGITPAPTETQESRTDTQLADIESRLAQAEFEVQSYLNQEPNRKIPSYIANRVRALRKEKADYLATQESRAAATFTGAEIAQEAQEMGSDQGGISDFTAEQIAKENYNSEEIQIQDIINADKDLKRYIDNTSEVREFEDTDASMDPIISSTGEVIDGYNRIHAAYLRGDKTISVLKGQKTQESRADTEGTGQTTETVTAELVQEFGPNVSAAVKKGTLVIVDNVSQLPSTVQLSPTANGAFDKASGVSYLIANRIQKGRARRVLLHEIGEHYGLEGMLGKDYTRTLNRLKTLKDTDKTIGRIWESVTRLYPDLEVGSTPFLQEVMAKVGEDAPKNSLFRRVVGLVKEFLRKLGLVNVDKLTTADLQDMVLHSLRTSLAQTTQSAARGTAAVQMSKESEAIESIRAITNLPESEIKEILRRGLTKEQIKENTAETKKVANEFKSIAGWSKTRQNIFFNSPAFDNENAWDNTFGMHFVTMMSPQQFLDLAAPISTKELDAKIDRSFNTEKGKSGLKDKLLKWDSELSRKSAAAGLGSQPFLRIRD